jgi:hypothetical protein
MAESIGEMEACPGVDADSTIDVPERVGEAVQAVH